jgi:hypothetical protein
VVLVDDDGARDDRRGVDAGRDLDLTEVVVVGAARAVAW